MVSQRYLNWPKFWAIAKISICLNKTPAKLQTLSIVKVHRVFSSFIQLVESAPLI